ncbi:glycosyltransferase family 4 protein [Dysgonomonas sp. GY75]|uniref:glycosyltransferase family 4 protein n=1 Tax=Dysgonomonas sp. GY75 TaxID=2780419 RepID=UPI00188457C0|nr:glycosyltransferase family 4 protein [Dysgonomonas sp. GY75]MBF0647774.1 glycosyltransferase family 4 protein [Dysgonomonas sp. GY75]
METRKLKVAIVISRYGKEINGGAELHARYLAEHLNERFDVTVLTSCENDDSRRNNTYYPKGEDIINGTKISRFESEPRDRTNENKWLRYLDKNSIYKKARFTLSNFLKLTIKKIKYRDKDIDKIFDNWVGLQGAYSPVLVDYIAENKDRYDVFIFFLYYQYTTYAGIGNVTKKSILIPIAHDDTYLHLRGFDKTFSSPAFIMYNSVSEKDWVEAAHPLAKKIKSDIAGVGRDKPEPGSLTREEQPGSDYPYFVYIGRIHETKGCKTLIEYFNHFKQKYSNDVRLILIGKNFMDEIETSEDIIYTGFISEQEKSSYLKNSTGLIIPSPYESLSMVTLEAMIMGKPVLANGDCDVLKKHIELSHAGYVYYNKEEFATALDRLLNLTDKEKEIMANNGISYVEANYEWNSILDKFSKAIRGINEGL